uniref:Lipopolysaccharide export system protein LptA n=1 Tax=Candidatus Kentrum sp. FW TaxID=2126338 RepID=A0A450SJJ3_9GAMM|nr:MAG: lipopolysaccharide export system protein LptA [Candidatus Kentron sp. FW]VFJ53609.1 MAG: lipopolysaccharide export system protein LptA [Candidatus Kentron sp. FW]
MIDSQPCIPIRKLETGSTRKRSGMGTACGTLVIYLAYLWFSISVAHALSTDSEQPIHIEADWAEASEAHKTVIYKGAVVITQGSMRINGEKVTLYYNEDHTLAKAEVEGRPARFQQRPDGNVEKQNAKANLMKYYADRDLILLLGNAHSWQGKRRVSAERIEFDTKESRVKAHGNLSRESKDRTTGKSGKSRVRIVVPAKKKN